MSLLNSSIVFFISPKKINKIIPSLKFFFKDRKIVICREMTKYYEEFIRSEINDLDKLDLKLKGELTIVISEKFFFYGFFPEKKKNLEEDLHDLSLLNSSIVFFISPKKIQKIIPSLKFFFKIGMILLIFFGEIKNTIDEFNLDKFFKSSFSNFCFSGKKP